MAKKIMFTGGGGVGNEAIWRLLSSKYTLYFADASIESIDDSIPKKNQLQIPLASHDDFVSQVNQIAKKNKIDVIVPSVDEELIPLCERRDEFDSEIFAPSLSFVGQMLNKFSGANAILSAGLTAPKTVFVDDVKELDFPIILKPKTGRGSRGVCVIKNEKEVEGYILLHGLSFTDIIAQELCVGDEYTVLVAGDKEGRLIASIPVKVDTKKGITIKAQTENNQVIHEYVKKFQNKFKPTGVYNIQCILTSNNVVLPFEVNPRISTTFCLGIASGFDPFSDEHAVKKRNKVFVPEKKYFIKRSWRNKIWND